MDCAFFQPTRLVGVEIDAAILSRCLLNQGDSFVELAQAVMRSRAVCEDFNTVQAPGKLSADAGNGAGKMRSYRASLQ